MELKENDKKGMKVDTSIYQEIAQEFQDRIPILSHIGKDQESTHISLRVLGNARRLASKMATKSGRFANRSEVERAAYYLGMMIIHHLLKDSKHCDQCGILFQSLLSEEVVTMSAQLLDTATESMKRIHNALKKDVISEENAKRQVENLITQLPDHLHKVAYDNCIRIFSGENIGNIFSKRTKGFHLEKIKG